MLSTDSLANDLMQNLCQIWLDRGDCNPLALIAVMKSVPERALHNSRRSVREQNPLVQFRITHGTNVGVLTCKVTREAVIITSSAWVHLHKSSEKSRRSTLHSTPIITNAPSPMLVVNWDPGQITSRDS